MNPSTKATDEDHAVIIPTSLPPPPTLRDGTSPTTPNVNITSQISASNKKLEEENLSKIASPPITAENDTTTTSPTASEPNASKPITPSSQEHSEEQERFNRKLNEGLQLEQTQPLALEGEGSELRDQNLEDEEDHEGSQSDDSMERWMSSYSSAAIHTRRLDSRDHREMGLREPPAQAEQDEQGGPRARVGFTMRSATPTIKKTKWTIENTGKRIDQLETTVQQTGKAVQQILETLNILMNQKSSGVGSRSGREPDVDAEISGLQFSGKNTNKSLNSQGYKK